MGKEVVPEIVIPRIDEILSTLRQFGKDASSFANKCKKPDKANMILQCRMIGIAFLMIGFVGYFVHLVFLPFRKFLVTS
jgi:protein transport protein SEC61 subunit gamma-like protein